MVLEHGNDEAHPPNPRAIGSMAIGLVARPTQQGDGRRAFMAGKKEARDRVWFRANLPGHDEQTCKRADGSYPRNSTQLSLAEYSGSAGRRNAVGGSGMNLVELLSRPSFVRIGAGHSRTCVAPNLPPQPRPSSASTAISALPGLAKAKTARLSTSRKEKIPDRIHQTWADFETGAEVVPGPAVWVDVVLHDSTLTTAIEDRLLESKGSNLRHGVVRQKRTALSSGAWTSVQTCTSSRPWRPGILLPAVRSGRSADQSCRPVAIPARILHRRRAGPMAP